MVTLYGKSCIANEVKNEHVPCVKLFHTSKFLVEVSYKLFSLVQFVTCLLQGTLYRSVKSKRAEMFYMCNMWNVSVCHLPLRDDFCLCSDARMLSVRHTGFLMETPAFLWVFNG